VQPVDPKELARLTESLAKVTRSYESAREAANKLSISDQHPAHR